MIASFMITAASAGEVLANFSSSGSNENSGIYFLLLGPVAGFLFYSSVYMRYRNTDKDNEYEVLTDSQVSEVKGYDKLTRRRDGLQNPRIQGDNLGRPRQRLGGNTHMRKLE